MQSSLHQQSSTIRVTELHWGSKALDYSCVTAVSLWGNCRTALVMPVSRDRRASPGFGDCRHTLRGGRACEQGLGTACSRVAMPEHLGGCQQQVGCVRNPPYLRRGHREKRWGLRGWALLGVTSLVMDIELWKAENTADTQRWLPKTALKSDALFACTHRAGWSQPPLPYTAFPAKLQGNSSCTIVQNNKGIPRDTS